MKRCELSISKHKYLVSEADVLLFRNNGLFSWLVKYAGQSTYSHCALASWVNNNILEAIEFREFTIGRSLNLVEYVKKYPGKIDVFTPIKSLSVTEFDCKGMMKMVNQKKLNGRLITNHFREFLGRNYSWQSVFYIGLACIPFFRLFNKTAYDDKPLADMPVAVCSSAIAYVFSKYYFDLTPFKSDSIITPGDLSRSPLLKYQFTLVP